MNPEITVVIPCHNQGKHLPNAINSVLGQSYQDFEVLLINDGSNDNTSEIMNRYNKFEYRCRAFHLVKQPNVGAVLNYSIREARGRFWVWCPADDMFMLQLLAIKHSCSRKHQHEAVIYSDWEHLHEGGTRTPVQVGPIPPDEFANLVWKTSPIGFTGIWIPMNVFDKVGNFPTHLPFSEDFAWMVRATIHGVPFIGVQEVLYVKRLHDNRTTVRNQTRIAEWVPKIREELRQYQKIHQELN